MKINKLKKLLKLIFATAIVSFLIVLVISIVLSLLVNSNFAYLVFAGIVLAFLILKFSMPKYAKLRNEILTDALNENNPLNLKFSYKKYDEYYNKEGLEALEKLGIINFSETFRFISFLEGEYEGIKLTSFSVAFMYRNNKGEKNIFTNDYRINKSNAIFRIYIFEYPEKETNLKLKDLDSKLLDISKVRRINVNNNKLYLGIGMNMAKDNKKINFEPISFENETKLKERFEKEFELFENVCSHIR